MKIAVDAMGGDRAPEAVIEGAVMALNGHDTNILLVGDEKKIEKELSKYSIKDKNSITIRHASQVVEMGDIPSAALRKKKNSSIKRAIETVKSGEAAAAVSAGNTGAVLAAATLCLRPISGIDRPAIATVLPTKKGISILLDAGANVDCKASQLFQFGIMGDVYAKYILGKKRPTVGILSIGEEATKGNEVTKEAFQMLKSSSIDFIGNIEGKEVFRGNADVIVCDGFTGNIALKISESLAEMIENSLRNVFSINIRSRIAYTLIRPYLQIFKKSLDHSEYGGAPLLGVNGTCIIAHGSSSPKAMKNAIVLAKMFQDKRITEHIQENIEFNSDINKVKLGKKKFWKQIKNSMSISFEQDEL